MTKEKLLIVINSQFGCCVDVYKRCEYLKEDYDITVLCFYSGDEKQEIPGVKVVYVPWTGPYVIRGMKFILCSLWHILWFKGIVYVEYFEKCIWLKRLLPFKKMILDVRTMAVLGTQADRDRYDRCIEQACNKYDVVSVISEGVKQKLHGDDNMFILPLGADIISPTDKVIDTLRLIYVGTFSGRDIDKTIRAVSVFHHKHPDIPITYDIIGSGCNNELSELRNLNETLGCSDFIILHGRIPNQRLKPYFDKANIGVSFVPMTDYYDKQPPTKTFEYTLSGMYTIATRTTENARFVTPECGCLIDDTEEDFVKAIEYIWKNKERIDSKKVRSSMLEFQWERIVNKYVRKILDYYKESL